MDFTFFWQKGLQRTTKRTLTNHKHQTSIASPPKRPSFSFLGPCNTLFQSLYLDAIQYQSCLCSLRLGSSIAAIDVVSFQQTLSLYHIFLGISMDGCVFFDQILLLTGECLCERAKENSKPEPVRFGLLFASECRRPFRLSLMAGLLVLLSSWAGRLPPALIQVLRQPRLSQCERKVCALRPNGVHFVDVDNEEFIRCAFQVIDFLCLHESGGRRWSRYCSSKQASQFFQCLILLLLHFPFPHLQ